MRSQLTIEDFAVSKQLVVDTGLLSPAADMALIVKIWTRPSVHLFPLSLLSIDCELFN